jgi:hypothetical protein
MYFISIHVGFTWYLFPFMYEKMEKNNSLLCHLLSKWQKRTSHPGNLIVKVSDSENREESARSGQLYNILECRSKELP